MEMTVDEYILYSFEQHFADWKNRNLVIYGTGPKTKLILEQFPDYHIVGVMDGLRPDCEFYGKPVLTYADVLRLKVDLIIVVAQMGSLKKIYGRISQFCYANQIDLTNINGQNLFDLFGIGHLTQESARYFKVSEKDLLKQIEEHDTISFDVFDTLIQRKTLLPQDVFDIVGHRAGCKGIQIPDFKKVRLRAEAENPSNGTDIYGIYDYLQDLTGISAEEKQYLCQLEITVERQVIIPRKKMMEIFEYALRSGKKVSLISDMYLPKGVMEEILAGLGICGYEDIFVSCDYGLTKESGLYELYRQKTSGKTYLHIGDNPHADGCCAHKAGLDFFLIQNAYQMMQMSSYQRLTKHLRTVNERSLAGLCISRVFNNPFSLYDTYGKPKINNIADAGYVFFGAIITNFIIWLVRELEQNQYEDILFSARDGYLIQELYHTALQELKLTELPEGIYFQTSRKLCTVISMENDEDIDWLARYYAEYTPELMLQKRFDLAEADILPFDEDNYPDLTAYALAHKNKITEKSKQIRNNYLAYMIDIGLEEGKKYALFDFCATGTSQYFLAKAIPYRLEGLYLCRYYDHGNMVCDIKAKSLLSNHSRYNYNSYFFGHYIIFETFITSPAPSLNSMDEHGEPVYAEEVRSEKQLRYVREMQNTIREYFDDYLKLLYVPGETIDQEVSDRILNLMDEGYSDIGDIFGDILIIDDMGRGIMPIR